MTPPVLIYCAAGNRRFVETAMAHGFEPGARLPDTVYAPYLYFADQEWREPDREKYMAALALWRPTQATVLDWEREEQLPEVLSWAEEAAHHVERVVIIPKVVGGIPRLPREIGGAPVVLGYSVPTRFAGTDVPLWELAGWPVHLLGGSPSAQLKVWRHLAGICDVVSADGNYAQRMAVRTCQFWAPERVRGANVQQWPTIAEADGRPHGKDDCYEAFARSCAAIRAAWNRVSTPDGPGAGDGAEGEA